MKCQNLTDTLRNVRLVTSEKACMANTVCIVPGAFQEGGPVVIFLLSGFFFWFLELRTFPSAMLSSVWNRNPLWARHISFFSLMDLTICYCSPTAHLSIMSCNTTYIFISSSMLTLLPEQSIMPTSVSLKQTNKKKKR